MFSFQTLLREVHQEGMQVLSLSELPLPEGESSSQFNIQGWLKERDALLSTVESLKGLITQMQRHRESQVEFKHHFAVCFCCFPFLPMFVCMFD